MKVRKVEMLVEAGDFSSSEAFNQIRSQVLLAVEAVDWHEQGKFVINPTRLGNGVTPIKTNFVTTLKENGWTTETKLNILEEVKPGPIDATIKTSYGIFAAEWETGNVSSSHRALNKIAIGVLKKQIIGGFLVVPVRDLARYLTDRIGNYEELTPYFPLYKALKIENGAIGLIAIEHDDVSKEAPLIPKGKDGNAFRVNRGRLF